MFDDSLHLFQCIFGIQIQPIHTYILHIREMRDKCVSRFDAFHFHAWHRTDPWCIFCILCIRTVFFRPDILRWKTQWKTLHGMYLGLVSTQQQIFGCNASFNFIHKLKSVDCQRLGCNQQPAASTNIQYLMWYWKLH